ncbi:hypothetical protein [Streptomyces sp. NPDC050264]|uniref:hypothetical protein n=1 Tax=Streptomyces sp. NPDC050264 TaxID=3155038 RepID=UPI00341C339A
MAQIIGPLGQSRGRFRESFEEYAQEWRVNQRHLAAGSVRRLDSLLEHHVFPVLGSRKMASFDHKVVYGFVQAVERARTGLATQSDAPDKYGAPPALRFPPTSLRRHIGYCGMAPVTRPSIPRAFPAR